MSSLKSRLQRHKLHWGVRCVAYVSTVMYHVPNTLIGISIFRQSIEYEIILFVIAEFGVLVVHKKVFVFINFKEEMG